eukprot:TRINITY_DN30858_c0_g1_i1.p1 TRINITY_DN30858_c0_g1~~TRINITY_DN30858_c0_g1_i1.p1  ORF type:complete len:628 (-),score=139.93 TRINITY_DN30858_c0_g1_i1:249-2132(-)
MAPAPSSLVAAAFGALSPWFGAASAAEQTSSALSSVASALGCERGREIEDELPCIFRDWYGGSGIGGSGVGWKTAEPLGRSGTNGELLPQGLVRLLEFVRERSGEPIGPDDVIADLGSGRGRAVLQAVLTTEARAVGVEISEVRSAAARHAAERLAALNPALGKRVTFVQEDLRTSLAWANATVVYMNAACFTPKLMFDIVPLLGSILKPGALVLSNRLMPGCHRGLFLLDQIPSVRFTWSKDVVVYAYVVAPRPSVNLAGELPWLEPVDWEKTLSIDRQIFGTDGLSVTDCVSHARKRWGASKPGAARLCSFMADGGASDGRVFWAVAARWLRSSRDGAPANASLLPSATACAWRELEARHRAERRGAAVGAQPGAKFSKSLVDLGLRDDDGLTILHHGAQSSETDVLEALLRYRHDDYAEPSAHLAAVDGAGRTALQLARHNASVVLLLQARADPAQCGDRCANVLPAAARLCVSSELLAELHGSLGASIEACEADGQTPLHLASAACSAKGGRSALQTLLTLRARPDARDASGRVPLHYARDAGVAEVLASAGSNSELEALDADGASPLHLAAGRRSGADVVAVLLRARASLEARDSKGATAMECAAQAKTAEVLRAWRDTAAI